VSRHIASEGDSKVSRATIIGALIVGAATVLAALIGLIAASLAADRDKPTPSPMPLSPSSVVATSITVTPQDGKAGTTIVLGGAGFRPSERIVIDVNGGPAAGISSLGDVYADAHGTFTGKTMFVPIQYGPYAPADLVVTGSGTTSGRKASVTFHLR
jgi:ABC-type Na+ efflux pump permease subunit